MKLYVLICAGLFAGSTFAGDNLAHEKLSRGEKKAKKEILEVFEGCAVFPSYRMRIEVSSHNLSDTRLVSEITNKVKNEFAPNPELTETEIVPGGGDGEINPAAFQSRNFSEQRNRECAAKAARLNGKFDVQSVLGRKKDQFIQGYILQARLDRDHATLYFLLSQQHPDYVLNPPRVEVGNDEAYPSLFEYEVRHTMARFETDGELQSYLEGKSSKKLKPVQKQQLALARELVMQLGGSYGEQLAEGQYLTDPDTHWELRKVSKDGGEPLDAVLFDESDDGAYTVFFHRRSTKVAYVYYEN